MKRIHGITLASFLALSSCQTPEPEYKVSNTVFNIQDQDRPYEIVFKKHLRTTTVFFRYETLYILNAAFFSDALYDAFEKASRERFSSLNLLKNVNRNGSFVVSIFAPGDDYNDLSNDKVWEFSLKVDDKIYHAKTVKKIKDKYAWAPFFPFIDRWSTDFIISFDTPSDEVAIGDRQFALSNSKAKTIMSW